MGAAMAAAIKFIQEQKRPPTKSEKNTLTLLSLATSWLVSLLLAGAFLIASTEETGILETMKSINAAIIIGVIVVLSAIYMFALSLSYGYLARKQYEAMLKKGKI